jgi:hypothetical protein
MVVSVPELKKVQSISGAVKSVGSESKQESRSRQDDILPEAGSCCVVTFVSAEELAIVRSLVCPPSTLTQSDPSMTLAGLASTNHTPWMGNQIHGGI